MVERIIPATESLAARERKAIEDMRTLFPDGNVSGLDEKDKALGKRLSSLYVALGYESRKDMIEALGFTQIRTNFGGGHPVTVDPEAILSELQDRYDGMPKPRTLGSLINENPDLKANLKTIQNRSNELYGHAFVKELAKRGLLDRPALSISMLDDETILNGVEELEEKYASATTKADTLAALKELEPDYADVIDALDSKRSHDLLGMTALQYFKSHGIIERRVRSVDVAAIEAAIDELAELSKDLDNDDKPSTIADLCIKYPDYAELIKSGKKNNVLTKKSLRDRGIIALPQYAIKEQERLAKARRLRNAEVQDLISFYLLSGGESLVLPDAQCDFLRSGVIGLDVKCGYELRETTFLATSTVPVKVGDQLNVQRRAPIYDEYVPILIDGINGSEIAYSRRGMYEVFSSYEPLDADSPLTEFVECTVKSIEQVASWNVIRVRYRFLDPISQETMLYALRSIGAVTDEDFLGGDAWREKFEAMEEKAGVSPTTSFDACPVVSQSEGTQSDVTSCDDGNATTTHEEVSVTATCDDVSATTTHDDESDTDYWCSVIELVDVLIEIICKKKDQEYHDALNVWQTSFDEKKLELTKAEEALAQAKTEADEADVRCSQLWKDWNQAVVNDEIRQKDEEQFREAKRAKAALSDVRMKLADAERKKELDGQRLSELRDELNSLGAFALVKRRAAWQEITRIEKEYQQLDNTILTLRRERKLLTEPASSYERLERELAKPWKSESDDLERKHSVALHEAACARRRLKETEDAVSKKRSQLEDWNKEKPEESNYSKEQIRQSLQWKPAGYPSIPATFRGAPSKGDSGVFPEDGPEISPEGGPQGLVSVALLRALIAVQQLMGKEFPQDVLDDLDRAEAGDESVDLLALMNRINDLSGEAQAVDLSNVSFTQGLTAKGRRFSISVPDGWTVIENYEETSPFGTITRPFIAFQESDKDNQDIQLSDKVIYGVQDNDETTDGIMKEIGAYDLKWAMIYSSSYNQDNNGGIFGTKPATIWSEEIDAVNTRCFVSQVKADAGAEFYVWPYALDHMDYLRFSFSNIAEEDIEAACNLVKKITQSIELDNPIVSQCEKSLEKALKNKIPSKDFEEMVVSYMKAFLALRQMVFDASAHKHSESLDNLTEEDVVIAGSKGLIELSDRAALTLEKLLDAYEVQVSKGATSNQLEQYRDKLSAYYENAVSLESVFSGDMATFAEMFGVLKPTAIVKNVHKRLKEMTSKAGKPKASTSTTVEKSKASTNATTETTKASTKTIADKPKEGSASQATQPKTINEPHKTEALPRLEKELNEKVSADYFVTTSEMAANALMSERQSACDSVVSEWNTNEDNVTNMAREVAKLNPVVCRYYGYLVKALEAQAEFGVSAGELRRMVDEVNEFSELVLDRFSCGNPYLDSIANSRVDVKRPVEYSGFHSRWLKIANMK